MQHCKSFGQPCCLKDWNLSPESSNNYPQPVKSCSIVFFNVFKSVRWSLVIFAGFFLLYLWTSHSLIFVQMFYTWKISSCFILLFFLLVNIFSHCGTTWIKCRHRSFTPPKLMERDSCFSLVFGAVLLSWHGANTHLPAPDHKTGKVPNFTEMCQ